MANSGRTTKNSTRNNNRFSFGSTPTTGTTQNNTPKTKVPESVTQQYIELDAKLCKVLASNASLESTIATLVSKVEALEAKNTALTVNNDQLRADYSDLSAKLADFEEKLTNYDELRADNNALSAKLIATEAKLTAIGNNNNAFSAKLTAIGGDIELVKQKSLRKTVELLDVPAEASKNITGFISQYSRTVGCEIKAVDVNNYFLRTHTTSKNVTKTKIIIEFVSLKKRMDFYFAGRDHRFNIQKQPQPDNQTDAYRFVKVVDALTQHKKSIFFDIIQQRKEHKDIIKNVWISDGDVFIRRFGSKVAEAVKDQEFVDLLFKTNQE
jgi:hypothetical protein